MPADDDDFIGGPDDFDPITASLVEDAQYEAEKRSDDVVRQHLKRTKIAYTAVFVTGQATPGDIDFVMHDLAWFCRAHDPLWNSNPREQDRNVARREVYQRILEYTRLDQDALAKRYLEAQG